MNSAPVEPPSPAADPAITGNSTVSHDKTATATPDPANARDRPALQQSGGIAAHAFAWTIVTTVLLIMPLLALAAVSSGRIALPENPRLAKLQVEIWPEFDRPAALVFLRGELAPDTALPAAITLRIPVSSGGPAAVAFANLPDGELFNLQHEDKPGPEFISVRFEVPQRYFHVEFYDPIATNTPERRYTYTWPGDFESGVTSVRIQEPAQTKDMSVRPALEAGIAGADSLIYRKADFSELKAGKPLPIEIRYTKLDSRTSSEILGRNTPDTHPPAATGFIEGLPIWLVAVAAALVVFTMAGTIMVWWRRRSRALAAPRIGTGFCARCGSGFGPDDSFCSKCGAAVRRN
jgi:hypothetical protein